MQIDVLIGGVGAIVLTGSAPRAVLRPAYVRDPASAFARAFRSLLKMVASTRAGTEEPVETGGEKFTGQKCNGENA